MGKPETGTKKPFVRADPPVFGAPFNWVFTLQHGFYQFIWKDFVFYATIYSIYSVTAAVTIRYNPDLRESFEGAVKILRQFNNGIPLAFVIGFYLGAILNKWLLHFQAIPSLDRITMTILLFLDGNDNRSELMRRTMVRYLNLCLILTLAMVSPRVKNRFPTLENLIESELLMPHEKVMLERHQTTLPFSMNWIPVDWLINIAKKAHKEDRIRNPYLLNNLIKKVDDFRDRLLKVIHYDWINVPLIYTQCMEFSLFIYFIISVLGEHITGEDLITEFLVPIIGLSRFLVFLGLMNLGESMLNPFGLHETNSSLNPIINRNFSASFMMVESVICKLRPKGCDEFEPDKKLLRTFSGQSVPVAKKRKESKIQSYEVPRGESIIDKTIILELPKKKERLEHLQDVTSKGGSSLRSTGTGGDNQSQQNKSIKHGHSNESVGGSMSKITTRIRSIASGMHSMGQQSTQTIRTMQDGSKLALLTAEGRHKVEVELDKLFDQGGVKYDAKANAANLTILMEEIPLSDELKETLQEEEGGVDPRRISASSSSADESNNEDTKE